MLRIVLTSARELYLCHAAQCTTKNVAHDRIRRMIDSSGFEWKSLHIAEVSLVVAFFSGVASVILSSMSLKAARSANQISEKSLNEAKTARDLSAESLNQAKTSAELAAESLRQTKEVADRELADWRQSKWFELYFSASEMCDTLEHFQVIHLPNAEYWNSEPLASDYNRIIFLNRKCLAMAVVFPKNPAVDKLAAASAAFRNREEVFSKDRLKLIQDAVQDLRELALLHPAVLLPPEDVEEIRKQMTGKFDGVPPIHGGARDRIKE
jgi:hypothetical protein